jgi:hypothetical protein
MRTHLFELFADYHQFYLWDAGCSPQAPEQFSEDDVLRRVKTAPHVVVVQPIRAAMVSVRLLVTDKPRSSHVRNHRASRPYSSPLLDLQKYDHVVDCGIELPTGGLQVHECTGGPLFDAAVAPGNYCVRVMFENLGSVSEDGSDGGDTYTLVIWPGIAGELRVLKQWQPTW